MFPIKVKQGGGLKILISKSIFQILAIAPAHVKAGSTSQNNRN